MKTLLLPIAVLATLSGCASVQYDCALKEESRAKCASMQDAYVAASGPLAPIKDRQSVFQGRDTAASATVPAAANNGDRPFFKGEESGYPEPGERGMPVFKQPEVHRVWVAPYVDADGNLRSGEYLYFSTPGQWNYGTTRRAGEGSAIFGPAKPGALGFTPDQAGHPGNKPAAPPTPGEKANNPPPSGNVSGITQPAQRLTP